MGEAGSECSVCNMCHGEGRVVDYNRGGSSMPENKYWMECNKCNGTGKAAQKEELEKRYSVLKKLYREASIKFVAADDKIKSLEEKIARIEIELKEEKMCSNAYIKDCEELTDKLAKAEELYLKLSKDFGGLSMQRREGIRGLDLLLNDFHDEIIHIWEIGEQDKEDYHERTDKIVQQARQQIIEWILKEIVPSKKPTCEAYTGDRKHLLMDECVQLEIDRNISYNKAIDAVINKLKGG